VTHHLVAWPGLARRVRVAQVTDIHAGVSTPLRCLRQALSAVRQAGPDVVVLTGDFLNRSLRYVERLQRFLKVLPKPCVAVLGNHDYWSDADGVSAALQSEGVHVLRNEAMVLDGEGFTLEIVGIDDWTTHHDDIPRAFADVARPENALVLSHHPRSAETIAEFGGRLILSGHTHGGQIYVPMITRAIGRMGGHRYLIGWYDVSAQTRLYVCAGIGSGVVGLRAGRSAIPEVAIFDLIPEDR